jgi:hypothetical protein
MYTPEKETAMQQTVEKATTGGRPRAGLVLALVLVAALGPGRLAPAGAAGHVVSSAMIPLTGTVGGVSLTGVLHVVTQVRLIPPTPISPATLTVYANLPAGDVTAVGAPGTDYIAQGAGQATMIYDDITAPNLPPIVPGFS